MVKGVKKLVGIAKKHPWVSLYLLLAVVSFVGLYTPDGDEYFSQPGRQNTRLYMAIGTVVVLVVLALYVISEYKDKRGKKKNVRKEDYAENSAIKKSTKRK